MSAAFVKTSSREFLGRAAITFSFDDGWKSVFDAAFPLLQEAGFVATHYVVSGFLAPKQFPMHITAEEMVALTHAGHEIGCHTVSHRHLPRQTMSLIQAEVILSKEYFLENEIVTSTFAYPYGEYDERVIQVVRQVGFTGARCTQRGFNDLHTDPFLLRVQAVKVDTTLREVSEWIDFALAHNRWLILMFHQVDHEGQQWSTTPETLKEIIDQCDRRRINVITIEEGLRQMRAFDGKAK